MKFKYNENKKTLNIVSSDGMLVLDTIFHYKFKDIIYPSVDLVNIYEGKKVAPEEIFGLKKVYWNRFSQEWVEPNERI